MQTLFKTILLLVCLVVTGKVGGTVIDSFLPCQPIICPASGLNQPCQCFPFPTLFPTISITVVPPTKKVYGEWSSWSEFSECPVSCGIGFQQRTRTCGKDLICLGDSSEFQACNTTSCPVSGNWGSWSYSTCSVTCGQGTQFGSRICGGGVCKGSSTRSRTCQKPRCPGVLSAWSVWTVCTKSCGGGVHSRTRRCEGKNVYCKENLKEISFCNTNIDCPGVWGGWRSWSSCAINPINVAQNPQSVLSCVNNRKKRYRGCIENKCTTGKSMEVTSCAITDCLEQTANGFKDAAGNVLKVIYHKAAKPTFELLKKGGEAIKDFFEDAAGDIGDFFGDLFG